MILQLLKLLARQPSPDAPLERTAPPEPATTPARPGVMRNPTDYKSLATHPHLQTYVELEPHFPDEGPDAVRSWFGGMPEMPEDQPWPRDDDGTPFVFLAQIDCVELPKDLWGGIGPRNGWLTYWVHPEFSQDAEMFRILHVPARGPARHEGGDSTSGNWRWSTNGAPRSEGPAFRKIPVRLVTRKTPATLSLPKSETSEAPALRPVTWGGLKTLLDYVDKNTGLHRRPSNPSGPVARANQRKRNRGLAIEDAERQVLRAETETGNAAALANAQAKEQETRKGLQTWMNRAERADVATPLGREDWQGFLAWVEKIPKTTRVDTEVAPAEANEYYVELAEFTPLFRPL